MIPTENSSAEPGTQNHEAPSEKTQPHAHIAGKGGKIMSVVSVTLSGLICFACSSLLASMNQSGGFIATLPFLGLYVVMFFLLPIGVLAISNPLTKAIAKDKDLEDSSGKIEIYRNKLKRSAGPFFYLLQLLCALVTIYVQYWLGVILLIVLSVWATRNSLKYWGLIEKEWGT